MNEYVVRNFWLVVYCVASMVQMQAVGAQNSKQPKMLVRGRADAAFPVPQRMSPTGKKDAGALEEIEASVRTSSPAAWKCVVAHGLLANEVPENARDHQATLTLQPEAEFRFEADEGNYEESLIVDGRVGTRRNADGSYSPEALQAALGGPFLLPSQIERAAQKATTTVVDSGNVEVASTRYQKVTLVLSDTPAPQSAITLQPIEVVDLYFDPLSHVLSKSVRVRSSGGNHRRSFLQVVSYGDYRPFERSLLPFEYTESDNGQVTLTFRVQEYKIVDEKDVSFFRPRSR